MKTVAHLMFEVLEEGHLAVFLDLVQGDSIKNGLDHATVVAQHHDVVRPDPQRHMLLLPERLKHITINRVEVTYTIPDVYCFLPIIEVFLSKEK